MLFLRPLGQENLGILIVCISGKNILISLYPATSNGVKV